MARRRKRISQRPKPFTVYPPAGLDKWLRELAAREGRTLTAQTVIALRHYQQTVDPSLMQAVND